MIRTSTRQYEACHASKPNDWGHWGWAVELDMDNPSGTYTTLLEATDHPDYAHIVTYNGIDIIVWTSGDYADARRDAKRIVQSICGPKVNALLCVL